MSRDMMFVEWGGDESASRKGQLSREMMLIEWGGDESASRNGQLSKDTMLVEWGGDESARLPKANVIDNLRSSKLVDGQI